MSLRPSVAMAWNELSDEAAVNLYDSHLELAEGRLDHLLEADPQSVRCKKLTIEFFEQLLLVRNALLRLAPGKHDILAAAFGSTEEGCERLARLLVLLNGGAEANAEPEGGIMLLQQSDGPMQAIVSTADRLDISKGAFDAYWSVAAVLDTAAVGKAIKHARERRRQNHRMFIGVASKLRGRASYARCSLGQDSNGLDNMAALSAQAAALTEQAPAPVEQQDTLVEQERAAAVIPEGKAPHTTHSFLQMLDEFSSNNCSEWLDQMFNTLDENNDGVLTGKEYHSLLDATTAYVVDEYEQKFSRYNMKCNRTMIARWVRDTLDQDGDGQITKEEFAKLKKVVDDID